MINHTKDAECTIDPETDLCKECGVYHGDPCPDCGGKGLHTDECPQMKEVSGIRLHLTPEERKAAIDVARLCAIFMAIGAVMAGFMGAM